MVTSLARSGMRNNFLIRYGDQAVIRSKLIRNESFEYILSLILIQMTRGDQPSQMVTSIRHDLNARELP